MFDQLDRCTSEIVERGYSVVKIPDPLLALFHRIAEQHSLIDDREKIKFSFPSLGDGFLPFGLEYAENNPDHPDLCDRFCYFRKYHETHAESGFANHDFYKAVSEYEHEISRFAPTILEAVCGRFDAQPPKAPGTDSYIQICSYSNRYREKSVDRQYLMDPHVDGQLLTFIAHTEQGLTIRQPNDEYSLVNFNDDELFVMAGELLEIASDGAIPGISHAVSSVGEGKSRLSVMYFLNPDFKAPDFRTFGSGRSINFLEIANIIHQRFGNPVYDTTSVIDGGK